VTSRHLREFGRRLVLVLAVLSIVLVWSGIQAEQAWAQPSPDAWGLNGSRQLGVGNYGNETSPTPMVGLPSGVTSISSGDTHTLALAGGHVWATGDNAAGELGNGSTTDGNSPVEVLCGAAPPADCSGGFLSNVRAISAGFGWSLAIVGATRSLVAWGLDSSSACTPAACYGQLGDGKSMNETEPVQVCAIAPAGTNLPCPVGPYLRGVKAISAGDLGSLALLTGGRVAAWGQNSSGELGDGTMSDESDPVAVCAIGGCTNGKLRRVIAISEGDTHSLAIIRHKRTAIAWGSNFVGELGNGSCSGCSNCPTYTALNGQVAPTAPCSTSPVFVCAVGHNTSCPTNELIKVKAISAGFDDSLALLRKHSGPKVVGVVGWGGNPYGELGDGTTINTSTPVGVCAVGANNTTCSSGPYLSRVKVISAGDTHSFAVISGGSVDAWGSNLFGELGFAPGPPNITCPGSLLVVGFSLCDNDPAPIANMSGVTAVSGDVADGFAIF